MHLRYRVELEESERQYLATIVAGGSRALRRVKRAQILLAATAGAAEAVIATTVHVGTSTIYRTQTALRQAWAGTRLSRRARGPARNGNWSRGKRRS